MRRPSNDEVIAIGQARDRAAPALRELADIDLEGVMLAALEERANRDGLAAASAWCAHWSDKLLVAAGREEQAKEARN